MESAILGCTHLVMIPSSLHLTWKLFIQCYKMTVPSVYPNIVIDQKDAIHFIRTIFFYLGQTESICY